MLILVTATERPAGDLIYVRTAPRDLEPVQRELEQRAEREAAAAARQLHESGVGFVGTADNRRNVPLHFVPGGNEQTQAEVLKDEIQNFMLLQKSDSLTLKFDFRNKQKSFQIGRFFDQKSTRTSTTSPTYSLHLDQLRQVQYPVRTPQGPDAGGRRRLQALPLLPPLFQKRGQAGHQGEQKRHRLYRHL